MGSKACNNNNGNKGTASKIIKQPRAQALHDWEIANDMKQDTHDVAESSQNAFDSMSNSSSKDSDKKATSSKSKRHSRALPGSSSEDEGKANVKETKAPSKKI